MMHDTRCMIKNPKSEARAELPSGINPKQYQNSNVQITNCLCHCDLEF